MSSAGSELLFCCKIAHALYRKDAQSHTENSLHHHLFLVAQLKVEISSECTSTPSAQQQQREESEKMAAEVLLFQKEKLMSLKCTIVKLEESLREHRQKITSLTQLMEMQALQLAELRKSNKQAQTNITISDLTCEQISALELAKSTGISCPPIFHTINHFSERMAYYKHDTMWVSAPFYTHTAGYKICHSMSPIAVDNEKENWICVKMNVHLMSGEFDDNLLRPFQGAIITVTATSRPKSQCNKSVHLELAGRDTADARSKQVKSRRDYVI